MNRRESFPKRCENSVMAKHKNLKILYFWCLAIVSHCFIAQIQQNLNFTLSLSSPQFGLSQTIELATIAVTLLLTEATLN